MTIRNATLKDFNYPENKWGGMARQLNRLSRQFGNLRGINGITVFALESEYIISGALVPFTGNGWIRGKRHTLMNADPAKNYLQINLSTNPATVTEVDGPPPDPWGDNEVWRKKSDIVGDLYID